MVNVLTNLFSKRVKDLPKERSIDIFTQKQLTHILKLISHFGRDVFGSSSDYYWKKHPFCELVKDTLNDFYRKLDYISEEEYEKPISNLGDLFDYFTKCKLYSLFEAIEAYGVTLRESCNLVKDFTPLNGFITDFNSYMEIKNKPFKLIITPSGMEVHKKTAAFAEENVIKLLSTLVEGTPFEKTEEEFKRAIHERTKGRHEDAIRFANNALETTMSIMGATQSGTESKFKCISKKYNSPSFIEGNYDHLQKIVGIVENVRSNYGETHGNAKKKILENGEEIAELIINMVGSLIIYLIRIYNKQTTK